MSTTGSSAHGQDKSGQFKDIKLRDSDPFNHERGKKVIYVGDARHVVRPWDALIWHEIYQVKNKIGLSYI